MAQTAARNTSKAPATGGQRVTPAKTTPAQKKQAASDAAKRAKKGVTTTRTTNKSKSASDHSQETPTHRKEGSGQHRAVLHPSSMVNGATNASLNSGPANAASMEVDIDDDPAAEAMRLKAQLAEALEQVKAVTAASAAQEDPAETIQELKKPKGEAGDKR